jgi:hypothetical protein
MFHQMFEAQANDCNRKSLTGDGRGCGRLLVTDVTEFPLSEIVVKPGFARFPLQQVTNWETDMRMIVLVFALMALAAPSQAAPKNNARTNDALLEQKCKEAVGKEVYEGEGRGGQGRLQVQRFGECMMGMPH